MKELLNHIYSYSLEYHFASDGIVGPTQLRLFSEVEIISSPEFIHSSMCEFNKIYIQYIRKEKLKKLTI